MKEKILALLTTMFAGVRKDGLTQLARTLALQAATEEEAKALVEKLTEEQVNDFIKEFRSEVDKEVSESNKTFETNLKKKFDLVEKKNDSKTGEGDDHKKKEEIPNDIAAIVKTVLAAELTPLKQELAGFKTSETSKARLQSLAGKLTGCKDETFKTKALKDFDRMKFETDDEFHEYLLDTEKDILAANQNVADAALGGQGKPLFTQKNDTGISQGVAEYVASQKTGANALSGKEV
jgi:predicted NAD-dependent protein-ADP-ribosyltransferase YbiA (DUF1768 family)